MEDNFAKSYELLKSWKGSDYVNGVDCLERIGSLVSPFGKKTMIVANNSYNQMIKEKILPSITSAGVYPVINHLVPGARPNAPKEDVYRLATYLLDFKPDSIVAIGAGSTIDACKAAIVLSTFGNALTPEIDYYFGTGKITAALEKTQLQMPYLIALETSASSASHLTKYSNITDVISGQKKLIVDNAIVPQKALFDYSTTCTMPTRVSIDGALDAIAHTFEVYCGANSENFKLAQDLAKTAISLVVEYAKDVIDNPRNIKAREAIGLATDLGGYAIMIGGTNGPHLTSFSLVDIIGHGTACGLMNPYYWIFYNKAIQPQLRTIGSIFKHYGYAKKDIECLSGRDLAIAVAEAMRSFEISIGAPYKLDDIPGFDKSTHISRALKAAKDPDLKMKLQNMPVAMSANDVDIYMKPILESAASGDFSKIKEMQCKCL